MTNRWSGWACLVLTLAVACLQSCKRAGPPTVRAVPFRLRAGVVDRRETSTTRFSWYAKSLEGTVGIEPPVETFDVFSLGMGRDASGYPVLVTRVAEHDESRLASFFEQARMRPIAFVFENDVICSVAIAPDAVNATQFQLACNECTDEELRALMRRMRRE